jgi:hypothetical protein
MYRLDTNEAGRFPSFVIPDDRREIRNPASVELPRPWMPDQVRHDGKKPKFKDLFVLKPMAACGGTPANHKNSGYGLDPLQL